MKRLAYILPPVALALALVSLGAAVSRSATPAPALAMTCLAPTTVASATLGNASACNTLKYSRQYAVPAAGLWVLTCTPASDTACKPGTLGAQPSWTGDLAYTWQRWPVAATNGVLVCSKAGVSTAPFAYNVADPCSPAEDDINKPLVLASTLLAPVTTPVVTAPAIVNDYTVWFECSAAAPAPVMAVNKTNADGSIVYSVVVSYSSCNPMGGGTGLPTATP